MSVLLTPSCARVSIAVMAGRRQVWTWIVLSQLPLALLTLALPAVARSAARPGGGWQAATLVATALLLAVCARRMVVIPTASTLTGLMTGADAIVPPVLSRLSPAAPGRPEQPRAPEHDR
jgi:hypothetical protein